MSRSGRIAVALLAAAAVTCGGGGGGGGGPTPPPPPPPQQGISFTTAGGSSSTAIALRAVGQGTTRLTLEVRAESVTDLYGVGFDLAYPANLLRFVSSDEGSFLSQTGVDATTFQIFEPSPGSLVVGVSRLGDLAGVSGSGPILTLVFDAAAGGSGPFTFSRNQAFDGGGAPIGTVQWLGGSVQVNL